MKSSALRLVAVKFAILSGLILGLSSETHAQNGARSGMRGTTHQIGYPHHVGHGGHWYPSYQPPVTFYDPFGNSSTIHPSAMQPGAQVAVPGTFQPWQNGSASGFRYMGIDGREHGTTDIVNPDGTVQRHTYGTLGGNGNNNSSSGRGRPFGR